MRRIESTLTLAVILFRSFYPTGAGWAAGVADQESRRAIISGHRGAVLAIDHNHARGFLVTAGADGTVRIWETATRSLVKSLTVASPKATMLTVSPERERSLRSSSPTRFKCRIPPPISFPSVWLSVERR
jgi:WD40 repeat protein